MADVCIAAALWNSLPNSLKVTAVSLSCFQNQLETLSALEVVRWWHTI